MDILSGNRQPLTARYTSIIALLLLGHLALLALTYFEYLTPFFNDALHRLGKGTDFAAYYQAGVNYINGNGIYGHGPGFGYRYHPAFAALSGILYSAISFKSAYLVWFFAIELAFISLIILLYRITSKPEHFIIGLTILVFYSPFYLELYMGNATMVVTAMLAWAFHFYHSGKLGPHITLMIVAIIVKPIGLIFLPLYLLKREWRTFIIIVSIVLVSSLPWFLLEPNAFNQFLSINIHSIPLKGWVVHAGNQGLHGFLTNLITRLSNIPTEELASFSQLPIAGRLTLMALPVSLFIIAIIVSLKNKTNDWLILYLLSSIYLIGYKDIWEHSYVFALVCGLFLYRGNIVPNRILVIFMALLAAPTAFIFYDIPLPTGPNDPEHYWSFSVTVLHHLTKSLPCLLLYLIVLASRGLDSKVRVTDRPGPG